MGVVKVEDAVIFLENLETKTGEEMAIKCLILSILEQAKKTSIIPKIRTMLEDINTEIEETEKIALKNEAGAIVKLEVLSRCRVSIEDMLNSNI